MFDKLSPQLFSIAQSLDKAGGKAILVGGTVRDLIISSGEDPKDYDVEVYGLSKRKLESVLRKFGAVNLVGRQFGVLKLSTATHDYDFSLPRLEHKIAPGHKGFEVTIDANLNFAQASERRDFTINALGYDLIEQQLLDPHQGLTDIKGRIIRHVSHKFGEDPLRVFRAMQFAARLEFSIAHSTLRICRQQQLTELPRERLFEEFRKLLTKAKRPSLGLKYLHPLGITNLFDFWPSPSLRQRMNQVVDAVASECPVEHPWRLALMLSAMLAIYAKKPPAELSLQIDDFLAKITAEIRLCEQVQRLLLNLSQIDDLYQRQALRGEICRLADAVCIADLLILAKGLQNTMAEQPLAINWIEQQARQLGVLNQPLPPLIQGRDLINYGLKPGPQMGELLRRVYHLQQDGQFSTKDEVGEWLRTQHTSVPASPTP